MLAGTRESDDPILSLRVNTYVWPTCTSDSAPLVAASKMVKLVFQTCTHTITAMPKRRIPDTKLPKAVLYTLAYKKGISLQTISSFLTQNAVAEN